MNIPYMENLHAGKLLRFEWKIATRSKTFAVAFCILTLLINMAMICRKSFVVEWKITKTVEVFPYTVSHPCFPYLLPDLDIFNS